MGERINRTDEVRGSSPLSSTRGAVAKLGSRLNGIEKAEGSSPSGSTLFEREATCVHCAGGFLGIAKGGEVWYTINNEIKAKHAKSFRVASRIS